jgi:hypothetical protein
VASSRLVLAQLLFEPPALPYPFEFPSLDLHDSFSTFAKADQQVANSAQGCLRSKARFWSPFGFAPPSTATDSTKL